MLALGKQSSGFLKPGGRKDLRATRVEGASHRVYSSRSKTFSAIPSLLLARISCGGTFGCFYTCRPADSVVGRNLLHVGLAGSYVSAAGDIMPHRLLLVCRAVRNTYVMSIIADSA